MWYAVYQEDTGHRFVIQLESDPPPPPHITFDNGFFSIECVSPAFEAPTFNEALEIAKKRYLPAQTEDPPPPA